MAFDLCHIGRLLREAREAQALTVEDISRALYLRKLLVEALEQGEWERLPHAVYVKGYVAQYATYLGIYSEVAPGLVPEVEKEPEPAFTPQSRPPREKPRRLERQRRLPVNRLLLYSSMVAIIIAFFIYQNTQRFSQPQTGPERQYETVSIGPYESHASAPNILDAKKLMIACQERTWVRVIIDGAEKKEFMLNPEEIVMLTGKERFDLLIGNAGGVKLFMNGKDTGFSGEIGEVKRVRLP